MDKMQRISIVWGFLIILIFGILTCFALTWKSKNNGYKNLEKSLLNSVKGYYESKYQYPTGMEVVTVTFEELKNNNVLTELKYGNDYCDGYVNVSYDGVINYKAYIKCNNYTSKGYNEIVS